MFLFRIPIDWIERVVRRLRFCEEIVGNMEHCLTGIVFAVLQIIEQARRLHTDSSCGNFFNKLVIQCARPGGSCRRSCLTLGGLHGIHCLAVLGGDKHSVEAHQEIVIITLHTLEGNRLSVGHILVVGGKAVLAVLLLIHLDVCRSGTTHGDGFLLHHAPVLILVELTEVLVELTCILFACRDDLVFHRA